MKKFIIAGMALILILTGTAHSENISVDDEMYISKPVFVSGGAEVRELEAGTYYYDLEASFDIEKNKSLTEAVTVYSAVYEGDILVDVSKHDQILNDSSVTKISVNVPEFRVSNENYSVRVFIWNDMESCAKDIEIVAADNADGATEYDMKLIRSRIEGDSSLYNTSTNPSYLLEKLGSDGKFSDIDYGYSSTMSTWSPSAVFKNVIVMSQAYFSEGNQWYGNADLKAAIDSVLNDWVKNKYQSVNWWFNEIDVPKNLSQILLYPFDENEPYLDELRVLALRGMPDVDESKIHKSSDTGGNLTDKLQTAVKIAAATMDADAMKNVVTYLLDNEMSVFNHASGGEGIMSDYSMHQHGSFLYNGSYGSVFCSGINILLSYLEDTSFMVSKRALDTYADFILEGHSWFFKNGSSDFNCFGRAISRNNGVGGSVKSNSLQAVNILTKLPGVERRDELLELKEKRLQSSDNSTSAAKHFYTSDMTVVHRPEFYIGVRTSSTRNINTEYMNGENSKASFIADGTTVIMKTGNEYRNIFPLWDWSRIPGTTTEYFASVPTMTSTYQWGLCEFVGGVSDGINAVSAMDYKRRGVTAKKSYFMLGDTMTALGAGIKGTTSGRTVNTTMNQCLQNGTVTYYNGTENSLTASAGTQINGASWVHHDNIGYYFPQKENVTVTAQRKSGTWRAINSSQSSSTVSGDVFSLYTDHGITPSNELYEYTILPSASISELKGYADSPDISVLENSTDVQAVWSKDEMSVGIVFWTKMVTRAAYTESVTVPADVTGFGYDLTIEALRDPCAVILKKTDNVFELSVSNPKNNSLSETYIGINRHLEGENAVWDGEKTVVTVKLPQGTQRGDTVKLFLEERE